MIIKQHLFVLILLLHLILLLQVLFASYRIAPLPMLECIIIIYLS